MPSTGQYLMHAGSALAVSPCMLAQLLLPHSWTAPASSACCRSCCSNLENPSTYNFPTESRLQYQHMDMLWVSPLADTAGTSRCCTNCTLSKALANTMAYKLCPTQFILNGQSSENAACNACKSVFIWEQHASQLHLKGKYIKSAG